MKPVVFLLILTSYFSVNGQENFEDAIRRLTSLAESQKGIKMTAKSSTFTRLADNPHFLLQSNVLGELDTNDSSTLVPPTSSNMSDTCMDDISTFITGITTGEDWALQMFDATGKPPSGILAGDYQWWGSMDQCQKVQVEIIGVDGTVSSPFNSQYCLAMVTDVDNLIDGVPPRSPLIPVIHLGLCLPDSCSPEEIREYVTTAIAPVEEDLIAYYVLCQEENPPLDGPAIGVICMLSVFAFTLVIATLYDIFQRWQTRGTPVKVDNKAIESGSVNVQQTDIDPNEGERIPLVTSKKKEKETDKYATLRKVVLSFSAYTNGKKILTVGPQSRTNLSSVHGIRFLSMTWVILGHTFVFCLSFVRNPTTALDMARNFYFQAILNATVSVDSFFLLSGTLAAFLLLPKLHGSPGPKGFPWHVFYIHRYWRLTPPYMIVLGFYTALFRYLGSGPMWPVDLNYFCRSNWWTNLLYVNNLVKTDEPCFGWAWYLANDMQFFLVTPLLVIPFCFSRVGGFIVNILVIVVSCISTAVISYVNCYPSSTPGSLAPFNSTHCNGTTPALQFRDVYEAPWCRMGPYVIGILLGYILFATDRKVKIPKPLNMLGWSLAAAMNLSVLYGLYDQANGTPLPEWASALYAGVHRNVWAVGLAWVIFSCSNGYGGFVNRLLSWEALVPLSRLTYMAYLIHPIIIYVVYFSMQSPLTLSYTTAVYLFFGHLVAAYGLAFAVSLAFEAPMIGIERIMLGK